MLFLQNSMLKINIFQQLHFPSKCWGTLKLLDSILYSILLVINIINWIDQFYRVFNLLQWFYFLLWIIKQINYYNKLRKQTDIYLKYILQAKMRFYCFLNAHWWLIFKIVRHSWMKITQSYTIICFHDFVRYMQELPQELFFHFRKWLAIYKIRSKYNQKTSIKIAHNGCFTKSNVSFYFVWLKI